jgi:hypothetical protein
MAQNITDPICIHAARSAEVVRFTLYYSFDSYYSVDSLLASMTVQRAGKGVYFYAFYWTPFLVKLARRKKSVNSGPNLGIRLTGF